MFRTLCAVSAFLAFVLVQTPLQAGKPSTPDERAKAVTVARSLETDPLGKEAKEQRKWLVTWLIDVSDISVKACTDLLGPIVGSKKNYESELFTQTLGSAAAFIIANPDKTKDNVAVYTAGLEGALKAYESILKTQPKAKWPFLDDVIEKRSKGELGDFVRKATARCK